MKVFFLILLLLSGKLVAQAHLCPGGGYYDAGCNHSGGVFQLEYKFAKRYWCYIRPQVGVATPNFNSLFVYGGAALELYISDRWVFSPNFCPGLYWKGHGRNLGHVIEFRSALELAYESPQKMRLGGQFYHISNASLGKHNPGCNALVFFLGIPL